MLLAILAVTIRAARSQPDPIGPNGHAPDAAGVLRGLAALGYDGIAQAVRHAREQTGLEPHELAVRLGLPIDAVALWEQGSFIPRTQHLLCLGQVLADHQPSHPATPAPHPDQQPTRAQPETP
jgi:hypothetical protein